MGRPAFSTGLVRSLFRQFPGGISVVTRCCNLRDHWRLPGFSARAPQPRRRRVLPKLPLYAFRPGSRPADRICRRKTASRGGGRSCAKGSATNHRRVGMAPDVPRRARAAGLIGNPGLRPDSASGLRACADHSARRCEARRIRCCRRSPIGHDRRPGGLTGKPGSNRSSRKSNPGNPLTKKPSPSGNAKRGRGREP